MLDRREFLGVTGSVLGLSALGLLTACGGGSDSDAGGESEAGASDGNGNASGAGQSATAGAETSTTEAPAVVGNVTEWNVVLAGATGGADPFSEYPPTAQYYLPWHIMEPLFYPALAEDGKSWTLVNELAKDWNFPDPQTLEVALDEGILFQNGEELTAEHVKVAYDTMINADPPTRRTSILAPLGEAEIVDEYTVRWRMPAPNLAVLGAMYTLLIPPLARQEMTAEEFEANPIGTGPYKAVSWPRDGVVELEAWENYRRGKVRPDRITGREVPDASTRLFELLSGNVQLAHGMTADMVQELDGHADYEITSLKSATLYAQVLNLYKSDPPLNNTLLRQAMNHAIDQNAIVEAILQGHASALPGPLGPGWLGFQPEHGYYEYDPEKAKQLLDEAGLGDVSLTWNLNPNSAGKVAEAAQVAINQLAEVGINVEIQQMETARLLSDRSEGNYDIVSLGFGITWMPTTLLHFTLNVSLPDDNLIPQWGETPDVLEQARELYRRASETTSIDEADSQLARVHELMHNEAFWLFLYSGDDMWGIDKRTGYRPFPTVYYRWYDEWARRGMTAPTNPSVPLILG